MPLVSPIVPELIPIPDELRALAQRLAAEHGDSPNDVLDDLIGEAIDISAGALFDERELGFKDEPWSPDAPTAPKPDPAPKPASAAS